MLIQILTLFPEMVAAPLNSSMIKKAQDEGLVTIEVLDIREFTSDKHRTADDYPYGGGAGMVLKPEPIFAAFDSIKRRFPSSKIHSLFMTPQGKVFDQAVANQLAQEEHLVILCGHYEGVDERVRQVLIDEEVSVGDFILTGGELPALVVCDAIIRLLPGVLGNEKSHDFESFHDGMLDYPQYTRPRSFQGLEVPPVLLSGHHGQIREWRLQQALSRTRERRPDLLTKRDRK